MFEDINKVLLITDMDGTFLPSSKIPQEKTLASVEKFQSLGGKFSIATGRAFQASKQYFNSVKVNCPVILCNGGMVFDTLNKKQIYDVYLPDFSREIVSSIIRDNSFVGCEVLTLENVYVPQMTELERKHNEICCVEPVECEVNEIPGNWYKVLFAAEPEQIDVLIEYVRKHNWNDVEFVRSSKEYYEILPRHISKGSALKKMREICKMEDYTIVAVGDYNNDIEMLKAADVGICPSNAVDDVKRIADIILDVSCEENAVAEVIEYIYSRLNRD